MSMTVDFTPDQEARIHAEARREGMEPAEFVRHLVTRYLPPAPTEQTWQDRLREWQAQDDVQLLPPVSASELTSQWATEYAPMTEAEQAAEDQLWQELEPVLAQHGRSLELRREMP